MFILSQTRQEMFAWCNIQACSHNPCCHGKAVSITYSQCVFVALVIQHVKCICCIILSVVCLAVQGGLSTPAVFFHIIFKMAQFVAKKLLNMQGVFWFSLQLLSEIFLILRRIHWGVIIDHIKYPLFVSDFNEAWIFMSIKFNDNLSSGAESFQPDEWKDSDIQS